VTGRFCGNFFFRLRQDAFAANFSFARGVPRRALFFHKAHFLMKSQKTGVSQNRFFSPDMAYYTPQAKCDIWLNYRVL